MDQELPLRDIHLPEAITWWPPAIGWWFLLLLIVAAVVAGWLLYKKLTRRTALKTGLGILSSIRHSEENDQLVILKQLSSCIRRVAMSTDSRAEVASLTGEKWLSYLDQSVEGTPFSSGVGQYLSDAHYRQTAPEGLDSEALINLCESWLKGRKA